MSWLARGLALPTRRLFLHHGNSGPIHLHIQDGHRLADDDGQIQLQGFLDLSLLALGDIGSDGLCRTLHGFGGHLQDRKSTRLNSSHSQISYAVFCLKKKTRGATVSISSPSDKQ